jgi:hypothetical protein
MPVVDPQSSDYDGNKMVSDGPHLAFIHEADVGETKNGDDKLTVGFTIHGPKDDDKGGKVLFQTYTLTDAAMWKYVELARAIDPGMGKHDPADQSDVNRLVFGKPLCITTEQYQNTWEGKTSTRVKVAEHRALTRHEKKALVAAYGQTMVPADGKLSMDSNATDGAIIKDDDIPF